MLGLFATLVVGCNGKPTGSWKGDVGEGALKYETTIEFASNGDATVHYGAPFDCDAKWTLKSTKNGVYAYDEKITKQGGSTPCIDGDDVKVSLKDSVLHYDWGNEKAVGDLKKR